MSEGGRACLLVNEKHTRILAFPSCTSTDIFHRVAVVKEACSVTQCISFN